MNEHKNNESTFTVFQCLLHIMDAWDNTSGVADWVVFILFESFGKFAL